VCKKEYGIMEYTIFFKGFIYEISNYNNTLTVNGRCGLKINFDKNNFADYFYSISECRKLKLEQIYEITM